MAAAHAWNVNGIARVGVSIVAPFSYATLIFAVLYDALFFDVLPDAISGLAAAIIIAGAVLRALREARIKTHKRAP